MCLRFRQWNVDAHTRVSVGEGSWSARVFYICIYLSVNALFASLISLGICHIKTWGLWQLDDWSGTGRVCYKLYTFIPDCLGQTFLLPGSPPLPTARGIKPRNSDSIYHNITLDLTFKHQGDKVQNRHGRVNGGRASRAGRRIWYRPWLGPRLCFGYGKKWQRN